MPKNQRSSQWRAAMALFIQERLQAKLDKLVEDDPRRQELLAQHQPDTWIADAARRAAQIQVVTHSLKPIHPDARGTSLYVEPASLPALREVGSHVLGTSFVGDVVCSAAVLDVCSFLEIEVDGVSLLAALLAEDEGTFQALHESPAQAGKLRDAFVAIAKPSEEQPSSHTQAKQLYWLVGNDPCADEGYELLAPLHATSLAQVVYEQLQEDRYGEANNLARAAYRDRGPFDGVFRDYPDLAVQKMGGSKPWNISLLNKKRKGLNYLLASLPPDARSTRWGERPRVRGVKSVLSREFLYSRPGMRAKLRAFRRFLEGYETRTMEKMNRWDKHVEGILDDVIAMACTYQYGLPPGWTADKECKLPEEEKLWLDPFRGFEEPEIGIRWLPVMATEADEDFDAAWIYADWPKKIALSFGKSLNAALEVEGKLVFSETEYRQWAKELLKDERLTSFAKSLHQSRQIRGGPTGVPVFRTHAELTGELEGSP